MAGDASEPTDMVEELPYLLSLKSSDAVLSRVPEAENNFFVYHHLLSIFPSEFQEAVSRYQ